MATAKPTKKGSIRHPDLSSHRQTPENILADSYAMVDKLVHVTKKAESPLNEPFILNVLDDIDAQLLDDASLLELHPPIIVVGDIHGNYYTLIKIFETQGWPPEKRYLFLGDYIDRGQLNLEVIMLLLLLKLLFPHEFYLLRGNHEAPNVNRYYGFLYELLRHSFTKVLWERFQITFNCLPLAALIDKKIFCTHGGISDRLFSLDQIRKIRRPLSMPNEGFILDLLWADPNARCTGIEPNEMRNASIMFDEPTLLEWLALHELQLMIRAHEVVPDGYEVGFDGRLLTVFSCPNYTSGNSAAIAKINRNLEISFTKYTSSTDNQMEVNETDANDMAFE